MTRYVGNQCVAGFSTKTKYNAHTLLDFKWSDHILNDISWLRADTFSWQDGSVYVAVYNYLVQSLQGATEETSQGVTFYNCTNGLRVALADEESNVQSAYQTDGVAWYYILDNSNVRFKLPRTKHNFTGLRDSVGKFVEAGLPSIEHTHTFQDSTVNYNATTPGGSWGCGGAAKYIDNITDANSSVSSIYGKSNTVQPPATQMYLYFYVGEFSQTATEQTAGLNAELFNAKVDLNGNNATFSHIIEDYINGTSGYCIWSNGYCEQWGYLENITSSYASITLIKSYNNATYILLTDTADVFSGSQYSTANVTGVNTFQVKYTGTGHAKVNWKASGYLAQGQY